MVVLQSVRWLPLQQESSEPGATQHTAKQSLVMQEHLVTCSPTEIPRGQGHCHKQFIFPSGLVSFKIALTLPLRTPNTFSYVFPCTMVSFLTAVLQNSFEEGDKFLCPPRNGHFPECRIKFKVPVFLQHGLFSAWIWQGDSGSRARQCWHLPFPKDLPSQGPTLQALPWWEDGPPSSPGSALLGIHSHRMGDAVNKSGNIWKEHDYRVSFFQGITHCEGPPSCSNHRLGELLSNRTDLSMFTINKPPTSLRLSRHMTDPLQSRRLRSSHQHR